MAEPKKKARNIPGCFPNETSAQCKARRKAARQKLRAEGGKVMPK